MEGGGGCEVVKGEEFVVVVKGVGGSVSKWEEREWEVIERGDRVVKSVVEDDRNGRGNGLAKNLGEPSLPSTT
ncbi:hypothetical protein COLO4_31980 [Corchorus olitorius]|uniref:Uncharacterized protein n=1 Tax=Corchorus olitorius TaxID=93759 RepID=A0A1R3H2M0_9ROSI|nr:hypothetical protein COLO4_31980 [Corchorus olitorius]